MNSRAYTNVSAMRARLWDSFTANLDLRRGGILTSVDRARQQSLLPLYSWNSGEGALMYVAGKYSRNLDCRSWQCFSL